MAAAHPPSPTAALLDEAWACRHQDVLRSEALLNQAWREAQAQGDERGQAYALLRLALCGFMRREDALLLHHRLHMALGLMRQLQDPVGEAEALNLAATVHTAHGDFDTALDLHQQALQLNKRLGSQTGIATALSNMGCTALRQGRLAEALALLDESQRVAQAAGARECLAYAQLNTAVVLLHLDQAERALDVLTRALPLSRALHQHALECSILIFTARAHTRRGRLPTAEHAMQQAAKLVERTNNEGDRLWLQAVRVEWQLAQGRREEAEALLQRVQPALDSHPDEELAAEFRRLMATVEP